MVSVTSDVTAGASYQSAPPKPALPDPAQLSSSFASMVDDSLPPDTPSAVPPAPEPAAPPRPSRDASKASDNTPPRKTKGADQDPPPSRADDSSADQPPPATAADANTNTKTTTDAPKKSDGTKQAASKSDGDKSTDKTATDTTKVADTTDAAAAAQQADTIAVVADPIAALIPAPTTPNDKPATPANANANPNAPLAIAAAAIAATQSTTASLTAAPAQGKTDATPKGAAPDATAKTETKAAAIDPVAAQQAVATDPAVDTDAALLTAAVTPGTTKANTTGLKTTATAQVKGGATPATGKQAATDATALTTTTEAAKTNGATPQPTTEAKPNATLADAVKPDGNGAGAPSTAAAHDHQAVAANVQAPANFADTVAQAAALPQQVSNTAPVSATDKFTVTQATGAPVPVSGLAVEIAANVQNGKTRFDVRLDPADLGRIDVRIDVDRNGQVTSHLTVEKPETLSMLRQDAPQLQQALNDAGLKTGSGGLQFSLRDQSQSGQNNNGQNQGNGQPQRLVITEEDTMPAAMAGRSYGRMFGANGGVDIRV